MDVSPSFIEQNGVGVTLMLRRVKQVEDDRDARKGCVQTAHVIYPRLRKPQRGLVKGPFCPEACGEDRKHGANAVVPSRTQTLRIHIRSAQLAPSPCCALNAEAHPGPERRSTTLVT